MRKSSLYIAFLLVFASFAFIGQAQDQDVAPSIEIVTSDPQEFYGVTVTLEGVVREYLNADIFVLSEGATLDDDALLVVNMSGEKLPLEVHTDSSVAVSGSIQPSFAVDRDDPTIRTIEAEMTPEATETLGEAIEAEATEGSFEVLAVDPTEEAEPTDEMEMATEEATVSGAMMDDVLDFVYSGSLPERYDAFTIIVITSIDEITFIPQD